MTNTNAIQSFGLATGSNVETPSAWAGDSIRMLGFQSGIASSQKVNTALRQGLFVSTTLAQFIADYGPSNVNDDGNVAALEAQFVAALDSVVTSLMPPAQSSISLWHIGTATGGSANALTTTLTPVPSVSAATAAACKGINIEAPVSAVNTGAATLTFNIVVSGSASTLTVPIILNRTGSALTGGEQPTGETAWWYIDGTSARLMNASEIAELLNNIKTTAFTGSVSTSAPNGSSAPMQFSDASTVDFTNNGLSGFTVITPGAYTVSLASEIDTSPQGASSNDVHLTILVNGTQAAFSKNSYYASGTGVWYEYCQTSCVVKLNAGDVVLPTAGVVVPAGIFNANANTATITFVKLI